MQHFWSDGVVEVKEGSSKDLMLLFGLTARDVRLLGTNGAHLSIRPDYFMFRLPPFTGCAWSDSVMIRIEGEDSRAANLFCACLKEELASPKGTQMPFEFLVLEVALRESFEEKKDRLYRLAAMINAALIFRSAGSETELRVGDFLVPSQKRVKQEHMLYKLLMLSNSLSALEVDVRRHEACLESVLSSDEDMAAMYLSHRRDSGSDRKVSDHQDVELLLESFGMQLEDLRDRIQKLQESVVTHSKMEQMILTSERNRIMRLELLMGMGTSSLTVSTVLAGFFGMNLCIGLEEVPGLFWLVMSGSTAFSFAFFRMLIGGVRRYHSAQREHLSEVRAFRGALEKEDQEYLIMRRSRRTPRRLDEDEEGMSRQDLQERLAQAGFRLDDSELDLLWETLDTNQDGRLSLSELGMSDEIDGPQRHCGNVMKLREGR